MVKICWHLYEMLKQFNLGKQKFTVEDTEATKTDDWDFWSFYAGGQWETTTVAAADKLLKGGDLLFDIGAWVGPLTLWEASRGVKVIAVEPDPIAFELLRRNVIINGFENLVTFVHKAVTNGESDKVILNFRGSGGDAWSSIIPREDLPGSVEVETITIPEMFKIYGHPKVIKMDIEGGESLVIPAVGEFLRKNRIPLLLATHGQWYAEGSEKGMEDELSKWNITDLHNQMWLCKS